MEGKKSHQQSVAAQCIARLQLKYRIIRFFIVNIFVIFPFNSFVIPTPNILIFGKFYWQKFLVSNETRN